MKQMHAMEREQEGEKVREIKEKEKEKEPCKAENIILGLERTRCPFKLTNQLPNLS